MIKEFKAFAVRGNVIDMAVGIVIGAAFTKIVTSLVNDVIMPPLGVITGGVDFSAMNFVIQEAVLNGQEIVKEAVTINYGVLINTVVQFFIVAFAIFMVVKAINSAKKKEEEAPAAPPAPSKEEILLGEIRDLLKK